jgi:hypothetical protein
MFIDRSIADAQSHAAMIAVTAALQRQSSDRADAGKVCTNAWHTHFSVGIGVVAGEKYFRKRRNV